MTDLLRTLFGSPATTVALLLLLIWIWRRILLKQRTLRQQVSAKEAEGARLKAEGERLKSQIAELRSELGELEDRA